jgi:hypothetical protein
LKVDHFFDEFGKSIENIELEETNLDLVNPNAETPNQEVLTTCYDTEMIDDDLLAQQTVDPKIISEKNCNILTKIYFSHLKGYFCIKFYTRCRCLVFCEKI